MEEQSYGTCPFVIGSFHLALLTRIIVQRCQLRVVRKFYLGQNEDYGLGDSISDSSKELLWRAGGKVSRYDSGERGVCAIKHTFLNKVAAPQGAVVNIHNFSAFLNISRCEN